MEKEKEFIKNVIDFWTKDTMNLSSLDHDHPAFDLIKYIATKDKDLVITAILEKLQKECDLFFVILSDIVPKKEQPEFEEYRGMMEKQRRMWLDWGKEKGYING